MVERQLVAKEEGLVGGHRLDHLGDKRCRCFASQTVDELREIGHAVPARHRHQAAFRQILFFGSEHETGALAQQLAKIVEVLRGHERSPTNSRVNLAAMSDNGSTAEQRPALVTCPGMPQTTLVASSCAKM